MGLVAIGVESPDGIQVPRQIEIGARLLVTRQEQVTPHVIHRFQRIDKQEVIDSVILIELSRILGIKHIVGGVHHKISEAIEMAPVVGGLVFVRINPFVVVPGVGGVVVFRQALEGRCAFAITFVQHASDFAVEFPQFELLAVHAFG